MLHVYDLTEELAGTNNALKKIGTGVYHGAVEVYGAEWSFGFCEEGTGVFQWEPMQHPCYCYKQSVEMGRTQMTEDEFYDALEGLVVDWPGDSYDLLTRNCCDFSNELCKRLGVGPIPGWVKSAAGVGALVDDFVHARHLKAVIERGRQRRKTLKGRRSSGDQAPEAAGSGSSRRSSGLKGVVRGIADLGIGVHDLATQETSAVLREGRLSRGGGEDAGYRVGDFCRGLYSGVSKDLKDIVAQGKQARGAEEGDGFKFGDFTRGAIASMAQR